MVNNPDSVYEKTKCAHDIPLFINYRAESVFFSVKVEKRNAIYYKKYPHDIARIRKILAFLDEHDVTLPNGGRLSPNRFLQLGIRFGGESKLCKMSLSCRLLV